MLSVLNDNPSEMDSRSITLINIYHWFATHVSWSLFAFHCVRFSGDSRRTIWLNGTAANRLDCERCTLMCSSLIWGIWQLFRWAMVIYWMQLSRCWDISCSRQTECRTLHILAMAKMVSVLRLRAKQWTGEVQHLVSLDPVVSTCVRSFLCGCAGNCRGFLPIVQNRAEIHGYQLACRHFIA